MSERQGLEALLAAAEEQFDPYAERILEAARLQFLEHGLRRTSLEDIARAADVSRATLFRRFPSRDALLWALTAREAQRSIAAVDAQVAAIEDPVEFLVAGVLAVIQELTENDLLRRLLVTDTDQMLPLLTVKGGPVLAMGREYIADQMRRLRADGAPVIGDPEIIGELIARIVLSLALNPESSLPLDDDDQLEGLVRTTIVPLILESETEEAPEDDR